MIIANPAKKEISIPLQPMTSAVSSNIYPVEEAAAVDLVTVNSRKKGKRIKVSFKLLYSLFFFLKKKIGTNDFIVQVFGQTSLFDVQVKEILSISTSHSVDKSLRNLSCEAFIQNDTVFISSPFVGANAVLLNWADGEFQSWYGND